jgi:RimJ/RimL family protein N-acetyltransferase
MSLRTLGDVRTLLETNTNGSSPPAFDLASYVSQTVYMRPLLPQDHEQLYFAALEPQNSYRWRYRGQTIAFREFSESLSQGVLAQFAFASVDDNSLVAFCSSYNYDPAAQHCAFAVQRLDFEDHADTAVIESAGLFLNYLFRTFNLRKVFADIPEYNLPAFGVLPDVFETEGTRRDYYWHAGRFWDEVTISTDRDVWQSFATSFYR